MLRTEPFAAFANEHTRLFLLRLQTIFSFLKPYICNAHSSFRLLPRAGQPRQDLSEDEQNKTVNFMGLFVAIVRIRFKTLS